MKNNLSFGAIVGYLSGTIILLNAISILGQGSSAIHQIYEILSFGFGLSLIVLGSIAQHTKNLNPNIDQGESKNNTKAGAGLQGLLGFPDSKQFEKNSDND